MITLAFMLLLGLTIQDIWECLLSLITTIRRNRPIYYRYRSRGFN